MNQLRASLKLLAFLLLSLLVIIPQMLVMAFHKGKGAYIIPRFWHQTVCVIFGIKYSVEGVPVHGRQVLYMFNHLSYLDIPLIGAILKEASFVAKSEVEKWPVFGFLAKLQQTSFIERRPTAIKRERDKIQKRVSQKQSLILFPEGTSTDGLIVHDFKSSLFSLADGQINPELLVQPATLDLLEVNGRKPQTLEERRCYTWPIEDTIEMPAHLWRFAKTSGVRIRVVFHDPLRAGDYEDRKTLAKDCHMRVSNGLQNN